MKILVIFTGGTIGSKIHNGFISPDNSTGYELLDKFKQENADVRFDTVNPYTVLSENLSAKELNILLDTVRKNVNAGYDGIIVTHGTDTMMYSANAVCECVKNTSTPIVFVSSNYPLNEKKANGFINFKNAVLFISKKPSAKTYISYKNAGEDAKIHYAKNIVLHREADDRIYSNMEVATIRDNKVIINPEFVTDNDDGYDTTLLENPKILVVESYVGNMYDYRNNVDAIIIRPYHSGTVNIESRKFQDFLKYYKDTPKILVNAMDDMPYDSKRDFEKYGIISVSSSFIPTYMKVWAMISRGQIIGNK